MTAWRLGGLLSVAGAVVVGLSSALGCVVTVVWLLFSSGMPLRLLSLQSFWIAGPYLGVVIGGLLLGLGNNLGRAVKRPLWATPLAFFGGVLAGSAALFLLLLLGGQHTLPSIALAVLCAPALAALTTGVVVLLWGLRGFGRGPFATKS